MRSGQSGRIISTDDPGWTAIEGAASRSKRLTIAGEENELVNASSWLEASAIPGGWRFYAVSFAAMLALAGLDMAGAVLAKEWTLRQHPLWFLAGLLTFGVLFAVYAASLHLAELSVVTMGWIVFLQVGLLAIDSLRYGLSFSPDKWFAIAAILVLQAYLVLAPNGSAG